METTDKIYEWREIADKFRGTLLVGNGGSIALSNNFSYTNLYQVGVESGEIDTHIQEIFKKFTESKDFEKLLRRLWAADFINKKCKVAETEQDKVRKPYTDVRRALINTVKDIHPDKKSLEENLVNVGQFCSRFSTVFTLNYDLTLMWATEISNRMNQTHKKFSDGFLSKKTKEKLSAFNYDWGTDFGDIHVYYLHGNLCLYQTKIKRDEKKLDSENMDNFSLKQLTEYWAKNDAQPLFVCEGISPEKIASIQQSPYLSSAYESLKSDNADSLVIYGWSMSKADLHILDAIKQNSSLTRVAISVYEGDENIQADAKQMLGNHGIKEIYFFDSKSSGCWANQEEYFPV